MCGIVAVLPGLDDGSSPDAEALLAQIDAAADLLSTPVRSDGEQVRVVESASRLLSSVDESLRGPSGLRGLLSERWVIEKFALSCQTVADRIAGIEDRLIEHDYSPAGQGRADLHLAVSRLKDRWWAIDHDRLGMARGVSDLMTGASGQTNLTAWWAIQVALASLGHLEVRGRDSAGIHILISHHGLDLGSAEVAALIESRADDPLFRSGSVAIPNGHLSLVYKAAAVIGALGDNLRALRYAIGSDRLLGLALSSPSARVNVIGHTRWASVGLISEANAHPVNSHEIGRPGGPYVVGALNGDVDNHLDLCRSEALTFPPQLTTDAKVIPALVSRRLGSGMPSEEAFRSAVSSLRGSVAVAASSADTPERLYLAIRGSGQSLNIGMAGSAYVVASEPYGLVEETGSHLRMDGGTADGETVVLTRDGAGRLAGIARRTYDGDSQPVHPDELTNAEITSRDIDRRGFEHFLVKELTEAPLAFRKTLRGRIVVDPEGFARAQLGPDTIYPDLVHRLAGGQVRRVMVIGQGTAAMAAQGVAEAISYCLPGPSVRAMPATELSGYQLCDSMEDTLVVAISQSGTTTDTNRTVDVVRERGAHVIAIVNRRNSDLVFKAHGVMYTSDGRDVEMSVASTKAFYAQIAAGWILAAALAQAAGLEHPGRRQDRDRILRELSELPVAMQDLLDRRDDIRRIAGATAPVHRFWSVVGSSADRIAAGEVRIKLSELCYRSISADTIEDKKHIDLSSEPMILVCAAGLRGSVADDAVKEIGIFLAHKADPIVIAPEGEAGKFGALTANVIPVPDTDPKLAFVLSVLAGHLFAYEAARTIDAQAEPLRAARRIVGSALEETAARWDPEMSAALRSATVKFLHDLDNGLYDGNLKSATAARLSLQLRLAIGDLPRDSNGGMPRELLFDLMGLLEKAVGELTRPIDAIKHQAKTVTVGVSRLDATPSADIMSRSWTV